MQFISNKNIDIWPIYGVKSIKILGMFRWFGIN